MTAEEIPLNEIDQRELAACFTVYKAAASAISNKDAGLEKEELLAPLPSQNELENYPESRSAEKVLGLAMLDIADQIYNFELAATKPYLAYSAEVCQRKLRGLEVPAIFLDSYPQLIACESKSYNEQILCGMAVAGSVQ